MFSNSNCSGASCDLRSGNAEQHGRIDEIGSDDSVAELALQRGV